MGAHVTLSPANVVVAAGETATFELKVRNTGTVVDEFTFEVLGDVPDWIQVEPPLLPLFPAGEETVRVLVTPPRASTTTSGTIPFAVRAVSREDPEGSAVAEATVDVGPFTDLFIELVPRTARGRRRAKTDLAVDNRGNLPVHLDLAGFDPDELLGVLVDPGAITSEPGTATFADVEIRPKTRFWRGPSKTLPFQVVATPVPAEGEVEAEPLTVTGTMVQEAVVPRWVLRGALLFLLLLLALIPIWFAFLKPRVESTARDAAQEEVEEALVEAGIDPAGGGGAEEGGGGGEEDGGAEDGTTTTTTLPPVDEGPGEPTDLRLAVSADAGTTATSPFTVPSGQELRITDIVLQNPQGDSGRLEVRRDGSVLLALALQNFRDIDYHFVAPIIFQSGQALELRVVCDAVLAPAVQCAPSGSFVGFLR